MTDNSKYGNISYNNKYSIIDKNNFKTERKQNQEQQHFPRQTVKYTS